MPSAPSSARPRAAYARAILWFTLGNAALLLADGYGYLVAQPPRTVTGWLFAPAALAAQLAGGALALGLYLDRKIYALFRYHVNGLVLGLVTTRAGWESMQIGDAEVALAVALAVGLLAAELLAYRLLLRRFLAAPRVVAERTGPVLLRRLLELGHRIRVLSSTPLEYAEFRRTVFVDVPDAIRDRVPGSVVERDRALADDVASFATDADDARPFFAFLFLDSTHAPYDFPPQFLRYEPSAGPFLYREVAPERRVEFFNRYRNAVSYDDHLVGDVLRRLEAGGRLDDTVILVTGDHGEECYEHGHWGHNAAFTPEQIRVPLVLHVPGLAPAAHDALTGHQDLAATFLEMLGVENPPADYSQGRSLLGPTADLFQVSCGWNQCALVDGAGLVVFGTEPYNARGLDVLDPDYREVADPARALRERSLALRSLMAEMSAFLR